MKAKFAILTALGVLGVAVAAISFGGSDAFGSAASVQYQNSQGCTNNDNVAGVSQNTGNTNTGDQAIGGQVLPVAIGGLAVSPQVNVGGPAVGGAAVSGIGNATGGNATGGDATGGDTSAGPNSNVEQGSCNQEQVAGP